jgi:hypothetical protein
MQIKDQKITRRKLVGWLGLLSLFTMAGAALRPWKNKKTRTIKMLTQDGTLVEIDATLLAANTKKISDKELQNWVKSK